MTIDRLTTPRPEGRGILARSPVTAPRTLLAKERGEIADFLRAGRPGLDEDHLTELLDFCELHGDAVELRAGVHLFLTATSWGADLFVPRMEAA